MEFLGAKVLVVRLRREHAAAKPQLRHGAAQLRRRRFGVVDGQIRDRFQARRPLAVVGNKIIVGAAQRDREILLAHAPDAETGCGIEHRGVDLLRVHRGEPLFELDAGVAERAAEIAVEGLARQQRRSAAPVRLGQIRLQKIVYVARVAVGIYDLEGFAE
jgi:hypothetical protein